MWPIGHFEEISGSMFAFKGSHVSDGPLSVRESTFAEDGLNKMKQRM